MKQTSTTILALLASCALLSTNVQDDSLQADNPEVVELKRTVEKLATELPEPKVSRYLRETLVDQMELGEAREFVLEEIIDRASRENEDFLLDLVNGSKRDKKSRRVLVEVAIAYWRVRMALLPPGSSEEAVLLLALRGQRTGEVDIRERSWAAKELCSKGFSDALVEIDAVLRSRFGKSTEEAEVSLCHIQVRLVQQSGSRIQAMSAALRLEDSSPQGALHRWAINGLIDMESFEADQELLSYALSIKDKDWYQARDVIDLLKQRGWTSEVLKELGWQPTEPAIRERTSKRALEISPGPEGGIEVKKASLSTLLAEPPWYEALRSRRFPEGR